MLMRVYEVCVCMMGFRYVCMRCVYDGFQVCGGVDI